VIGTFRERAVNPAGYESPSNAVTAGKIATTVWTGIERSIARVPHPRGYRFALLEREQIDALIARLHTWFPEIRVGSASCYLDERFYRKRVYFVGEPEQDVLVVLVKKGDELAGLFSAERDRDALSLYARLGAVAPPHRGRGLSHCFPSLAEAIGHAAGVGMVYGMATLKVPYVQRAFERSRWMLIGITPGYDCELVAPGVVKRVYEAVYAKVLVARGNLLRPHLRNLTKKTQAFFTRVFPRKALASGD
jgi:hypothetical protein